MPFFNSPFVSLVKKTQNFRGSVDPFKVKTVDTTGAGDSFVGALLCKIVDDQSVLEVLISFVRLPYLIRS